jgi:serine protease inhibitor
VPAQEIEQALAAGTSTDDVVAELAAGAAKVARHHAVPGDDSVLAVANTLWVDDSRRPVAHFLQQLERWPGAALRFAPMIADPDGVRAAINADVARTTRGLIKEILPEGSVTSDDRAVIANALYLLAGWIDRFDAARTSDEPFDAPSGQRDVPTMRGAREAAYAHDAWEYLALPLWRDLQAEILLPPAGTAAENVVQGVDCTLLVELRRQATDHRVDVHLPRFRVERWNALIPALEALGVHRIFHEPVLTGIVVEQSLLVVAGVFHAAVLRVDERGIEGAAATAMVVRGIAYRRLPVVEMRVDRPFFLLVTHRGTGAVIFLAYDPCQSGCQPRHGHHVGPEPRRHTRHATPQSPDDDETARSRAGHRPSLAGRTRRPDRTPSSPLAMSWPETKPNKPTSRCTERHELNAGNRDSDASNRPCRA